MLKLIQTRFSSKAGINDIWIEVDFNNLDFEVAVIRYIQSCLGERYSPIRTSSIEFHF